MTENFYGGAAMKFIRSAMLCLVFICLFSSFSVFSEPEVEWSNNFGGMDSDHGRRVFRLDDGYLIFGSTYSFGAGSNDVYALEINSYGNWVNQKTFGGESADSCMDALRLPDGSFILAGYTLSGDAQSMDILLMKLNASLTESWSVLIGGTEYDGADSVDLCNDKGFILVGSTDSKGAGGDDIYLVKTDSSGELQWDKTFGGPGYDYGHCVKQTTDGGYIIAGELDDGSGFSELYILKTDASGNKDWAKTFGGEDMDSGFSVIQAGNGDFLVGGYTATLGAGDGDMFLIRVDSNGNEKWRKTYDGGKNASINCIVPDSSGGYILAGKQIVSIDASGDVNWSMVFADSAKDEARSIIPGPDDSWIIAGSNDVAGGFFPDYDVSVMKIATFQSQVTRDDICKFLLGLREFNMEEYGKADKNSDSFIDVSDFITGILNSPQHEPSENLD